MSTALSVVQAKEVVTAQDLDVLKRSKFKGFEDHEIAYCARVSNALALNPLLNQIHFVKRKNRDGSYSITPQTGIDGFRLSAQRAGGYAGSDDAVFEYAATDKAQKRPTKATVTVYRIVEGHRCPFTGSARWDEFFNPVGGQWDRMPHVMLSKCAEALALRKAFPAELANIKTDEEMDQADRPNKAQTVQAQIVPQQEQPAIEAESRPIEQGEDPPVDGCPKCQSQNVMESRYRAGTMFCRDCRAKYPKEGA